MKKLQTILMGGMLLLPLVNWAGDDDPCGLKLRITQQVNWGQTRRLQAVETIDATNTISQAAQGDYHAGRSITLSPGFHAERGSLFAAQVRTCECNSSVIESSRLTLTAYPNPFIESTVIRYQLVEESPVNLTLLNEQGQTVTVLVSETSQEAGIHEYKYRNPSLQESVYLYSLRTNKGVITKRLVKSH